MATFKGTFNWYCELHVLYTHAKNEKYAFSNFIVQLSKKLSRNKRSIYTYFVYGIQDKYKIKEVKQFVKETKT